MHDEVLALCYESDITIQRINYEILQENYNILLEGEDNSDKSFFEKFKEAVKTFFEKVLFTMKRVATRILTITKQMNMYGAKSDVDGKMDDMLVPVYSLNRICDWASNQISAVSNLKEKHEYISFEKSNSDAAKSKKGTYGTEKAVLDGYSGAIKFVNYQYKYIQNQFKYDLSDKYGSSEEGKKILNNIFKIQKEAISLIQKRTNIAIKFITTAIKRSFNPLIHYKKVN